MMEGECREHLFKLSGPSERFRPPDRGAVRGEKQVQDSPVLFFSRAMLLEFGEVCQQLEPEIRREEIMGSSWTLFVSASVLIGLVMKGWGNIVAVLACGVALVALTACQPFTPEERSRAQESLRMLDGVGAGSVIIFASVSGEIDEKRSCLVIGQPTESGIWCRYPGDQGQTVKIQTDPNQCAIRTSDCRMLLRVKSVLRSDGDLAFWAKQFTQQR